MDKIIHIANNFNVLFVNCDNAITYTPPARYNIEALIILNSIIEIICKKNTTRNITNEIVCNTLDQIIAIKCEEFCQEALKLNVHINIINFTKSFCNYIELKQDEIMNNYNSNMEY